MRICRQSKHLITLYQMWGNLADREEFCKNAKHFYIFYVLLAVLLDLVINNSVTFFFLNA